jgi:carboxypeptidase C (cathepsin A)
MYTWIYKRKPMKKYLVLVLVSLLYTTAFGQKDSSQTNNAIPSPIKIVTRHNIILGGKSISYTAIAGAMILKNEKDEAIALFGYTAYFKEGETDLSKRPLIFAYNGGPGSSSMWLHMGVLGPKRVVVNDPENTPPPPYKTEDNSNSIIDVSDLVMIDPIGTGLSHAVGKAKNKDFWGVDPDIKIISQFIKQFVIDNDRLNSPKFLLGESYGTTRSAGIVDYLQESMGMSMNGVILVSAVLDLKTLEFSQGDDISYILYLPSYASAAWYHKKLTNQPPDLDLFMSEVRVFATGEYANALMKGDNLTELEKNNIALKIASFIGLSKEYILKANLRIKQPQFTQELLRDDHTTIGRYDSRYKGITQNLLSEYSYFDPQSSSIEPAFTTTFLNYYYTDLKMDKSKVYRTWAYGLEGFTWDWKHAKNGPEFIVASPNTAVDLAEAMTMNPNLRVLVLNGYFDLATPFLGTEFTFDHLGLEPKLKKNITMKYYKAGHMMYIEPLSSQEFKKDVAAFINSVVQH